MDLPPAALPSSVVGAHRTGFARAPLDVKATVGGGAMQIIRRDGIAIIFYGLAVITAGATFVAAMFRPGDFDSPSLRLTLFAAGMAGAMVLAGVGHVMMLLASIDEHFVRMMRA